VLLENGGGVGRGGCLDDAFLDRPGWFLALYLYFIEFVKLPEQYSQLILIR